MDYGLVMEGIIRNNNPLDARYDFETTNEGKCTYWPGTDKLHIHRANWYTDNGLDYIYNTIVNNKNRKQ